MSVDTYTVSLRDKIALIDQEIQEFRPLARSKPDDPEIQNWYRTLKAIAADLQARLDVSRHDAIEDLNGAIDAVRLSKDSGQYGQGQMIRLANTVIHRWPSIMQAMELWAKGKD